MLIKPKFPFAFLEDKWDGDYTVKLCTLCYKDQRKQGQHKHTLLLCNGCIKEVRDISKITLLDVQHVHVRKQQAQESLSYQYCWENYSYFKDTFNFRFLYILCTHLGEHFQGYVESNTYPRNQTKKQIA